MRSVTLSAIKAGMTRLRDKGGASPETLYDLVNGHVDASGSPTIRPGTVHDVSLPVGTKGLCAFQGKMHVFSANSVVSPDPRYVVNILKHPDTTYVGGLFKIHFAKPYLGFLYVVAEFEDGTVRHYWLQVKAAWAANTIYGLDDIVSPSVANGHYYQTATKSSAPAWAAGQTKALGDVVQPSTPNGWEYVVTDVTGTPVTGSTEPGWPTAEGATVFEGTDTITVPSSGSGSPPNLGQNPGQNTIDRYGDGK